MFEVELLFDAEAELSDSYDWYAEKSNSLGNRFYHEVNRYINLIANNPFHFPVRYANDLRAAALNKFPFLVIYWIDEINSKVYVVSIFHTGRNPKYS